MNVITLYCVVFLNSFLSSDLGKCFALTGICLQQNLSDKFLLHSAFMQNSIFVNSDEISVKLEYITHHFLLEFVVVWLNSGKCFL